MTTGHDIDWPEVLAERLTTTHPDVLRELLTTFIHTLMGAEADVVCGAGYGHRSAERTNQRNGYRPRQFDTRAGSLDLAIPKLRHRSYFPDWPLEQRKRAERALSTVVATCYLIGVSTRRMDKLVETLGDHEPVEVAGLLAEIGAVPSIGTVGDSFDNALAETVNGYYKSELVYGPTQTGPWKTIADVELATLGWVHWHNTSRLHGYLDDLPPAEFEASHVLR
jgi:hypothetical protein